MNTEENQFWMILSAITDGLLVIAVVLLLLILLAWSRGNWASLPWKRLSPGVTAFLVAFAFVHLLGIWHPWVSNRWLELGLRGFASLTCLGLSLYLLRFLPLPLAEKLELDNVPNLPPPALSEPFPASSPFQFTEDWEHLPVGVCLLDEEGCIREANQSAFIILGCSRLEAVGQPLRFFLVEHVPFDRWLQQIREGEFIFNQIIALKTNGRAKWVSFDAGGLWKQGEFMGMRCFVRDITEDRRQVEEWRTNAQKFRLMADAAPVLIWMAGPDSLCTYFNQVWLKFTGRRLEQELDNGWTESVYLEDRALCLERYLSAFVARQEFTVEYRLRRHDGEYRWLLNNGVPIFSPEQEFLGYISSCVDITERKATEKERERLAWLLDNTSDYVGMTNANGQRLYMNRAGQRMLGLQDQEMTHLISRADVHPAWAYEILQKKAIPHAKEFGVWTGETAAIRSDGQEIPWSQVILARKDAQGEIEFFATIARDISERKRFEQALIRAKESAEAGERAKAEFLATISHEIRTPLNGILGMTQLLQQTPLNSEQRDYFQIMQISSEQLLRVIGDILDFSKLDTGQLTLENSPFAIRSCLESSLALVWTEFHHKMLEVALWVAPEVPLLVMGDATRLRQVFVNLIHNAFKFTKQGEVIIEVSLSQAVSPQLCFSIRDSGIGITETQRKSLFQAFSQADSSSTRRYGGAGLGLAIASRIMQLMGGSLQCQSTLGQGSTFVGKMPCRPVKHDLLQEVSPIKLPPLKLLLLEDHRTTAEFFQRIVQFWGCQIQVAESALQAIEWSTQASFDVYVIDETLFPQSGCEIWRIFHQQNPTRQVIFLVPPSLSLECFQSQPGVLGVLYKPVMPDRLRELLVIYVARVTN